MDQLTAYLTAGGSASGKSTGIADMLAKGEIHGILIDCDQFIAQGYEQATALARQQFEQALAARATMIVDATLANEGKAFEQIQRLRQAGYAIILHQFDCPLEEAPRRNAARSRRVPAEIVRATAERSRETVARLIAAGLIDRLIIHS